MPLPRASEEEEDKEPEAKRQRLEEVRRKKWGPGLAGVSKLQPGRAPSCPARGEKAPGAPKSLLPFTGAPCGTGTRDTRGNDTIEFDTATAAGGGRGRGEEEGQEEGKEAAGKIERRKVAGKVQAKEKKQELKEAEEVRQREARGGSGRGDGKAV